MSEPLELRVNTLAFGGAAVGRLASGKAVLVHGAAAGEKVRAAVLLEKKTWIEAEVTEVLEASSERVEPTCPFAGQCGGCSWMHIDIDAQRAWKRRLLTAELERAGLEQVEELVRPLVSGEPLGMRTRCRLHFQGGRLGYRVARSHDVVPFESCAAIAPALEKYAKDLVKATHDRGFDDIELELTVDAEGRRGLFVDSRAPADMSVWREIGKTTRTKVVAVSAEGRRRIIDGGLLREASAEAQLDFEPGLFVQTNREMNRHLVETVIHSAGSGHRAVELYAGVGNFTIHLANRFENVAAYEGSRDAVRMLQRNVGGRHPSFVAHAEGDRRTAQRLSSLPPPDLVVADPPRAGMKAFRRYFKRVRPQRVVMVSCHPMAAIRDLGHLVREAGYSLVEMTPFDMFPQTHHLELVAVLKSRQARA